MPWNGAPPVAGLSYLQTRIYVKRCISSECEQMHTKPDDYVNITYECSGIKTPGIHTLKVNN